MSNYFVTVGLGLLIPFLITSVAQARIITIDCTFKIEPNGSTYKIEYVDNLDIHNKVTVIGSFGSRTATSYMAGTIMFVLESEADTSASTLMDLDPNINIVAARFTITTAGPTGDAKPFVITSQGACRVKR